MAQGEYLGSQDVSLKNGKSNIAIDKAPLQVNVCAPCLGISGSLWVFESAAK